MSQLKVIDMCTAHEIRDWLRYYSGDHFTLDELENNFKYSGLDYTLNIKDGGEHDHKRVGWSKDELKDANIWEDAGALNYRFIITIPDPKPFKLKEVSVNYRDEPIVFKDLKDIKINNGFVYLSEKDGSSTAINLSHVMEIRYYKEEVLDND